MSAMLDVDRGFFKTAMSAPYLSHQEERELTTAWIYQGDEKAMHRLTHAHMRLVISLAAKFKNYGLSMPDLVQEGHIGLLQAAAKFEPERDLRFSTYATWWIRASMQDYVLRNWSIVRGGTSSSQKALFFNLRRLRAQISQAAGTEMSVETVYAQIAEKVGVSVADVNAMAARLSGPDTSLNAPLSDDDGNGSGDRMDFLVDHNPLPDVVVEDSIDTGRRVGWLRAALNVLTDREVRIIKERRLQDEASTLEALGAKLGISKERVRQIEGRALEKLKRALLDRHPNTAVLV